MKESVSFMAIAKGKESVDGSFKRYIGIGSCFVRSINPSKAELEKIYGTSLENEPEYLGTTERDDKTVPNMRLTFLLQPDEAVTGFKVDPISASLFLTKAYNFNRDKTKVQVIDKYGRTAWVTIEQAKNHEIPMYKNGPANLDKDYRPAYIGEEKLTNFILNFLNIPSPMKYNKEENKWYMVSNPEDSECRLDNMDALFNGDITEVKNSIALQPTNKVKVLFGIRNSDDGRQYQTIYDNCFLKNSVTNYSKLDKELQEARNNGRFATTEFEVCDLKEYSPASTTFEMPTSDAPTPEESSDDPFWNA